MAEEWTRLDPPFIICAYFECEHCHRPIHASARSEVLTREEDWDDYSFRVDCGVCGWGSTAYPGSKAVYRRVVEWTSKVRSIHRRNT